MPKRTELLATRVDPAFKARFEKAAKPDTVSGALRRLAERFVRRFEKRR